MRPTPVYLPRESHGQRESLGATVHGVGLGDLATEQLHSVYLNFGPGTLLSYLELG